MKNHTYFLSLFVSSATFLLLLPPPTTTASSDFTLAGKSIYFTVTDRFAKGVDDTSDAFDDWCDRDAEWVTRTDGGYCGGTFRGIIDNLDYISGMGFDCVWITPVVSSQDYTGYAATNLFEINSQFGSSTDLKSLSDALHERDMCLIVDVVTNHMGSMIYNQSTLVLDQMYPFNKPEHYNQLYRGANQSYDDYVLQRTAPDPSQSLGNKTAYIESYNRGEIKCGPTNLNATLCLCFPGNTDCPGYDTDIQLDGWFAALYKNGYGDLNQTIPYVKDQLLNYTKTLVDTYNVDAIRLDTAIYMERDFLHELQDHVGVEIIGETTVANLSYHASFQQDASGQVLRGLLNFPLFYVVPDAFCNFVMTPPLDDNNQGTWEGSGDLSHLASIMRLQQKTENLYENLDLLGNFADNHDEFARIGRYCQEFDAGPIDVGIVKNVLTFVMMTQGVPIIYYGTEQGLEGYQTASTNPSPRYQNVSYANGGSAVRESLWQTKYLTDTWQYQHISNLNRLRKSYGIGEGESSVIESTGRTLVFTRPATETKTDAWIFLNNYDRSERERLDSVTYCPGPSIPENGDDDYVWYNVLINSNDISTAQEANFVSTTGCFVAPNADPQVLVLLPKKRDYHDNSSEFGGSAATGYSLHVRSMAVVAAIFTTSLI
jgi:glycosidase